MQVRQLNGLGSGLSAFPCGDSNTFVLHHSDTIVSPCSSSHLGKFQGLQRAINAYVIKFGVGDTVTVDGDIGPATLREAQTVWQHGFDFGKSGWPAVRPTTVGQLANVEIYTKAFAGAADATVDLSADAAAGPKLVVGNGAVPVGGVKKSGMGIFLLAAAAGIFAFKVAGRKKGR